MCILRRQENRVYLFPPLKNEVERSVMSFLKKAVYRVGPCSTLLNLEMQTIAFLFEQRISFILLNLVASVCILYY